MSRPTRHLVTRVATAYVAVLLTSLAASPAFASQEKARPAPAPGPGDMAVTAADTVGMVGDKLSVEVTVHRADAQSYYLVVPIDAGGARYVGDCMIFDGNACINGFDRAEVPTRVHRPPYVVTAPGRSTVTVSIVPLEQPAPNDANNRATVTIAGLPAGTA